MSQYLKLYLITLAMFLAMDFVWLKIVARSFYQNQLTIVKRIAEVDVPNDNLSSYSKLNATSTYNNNLRFYLAE